MRAIVVVLLTCAAAAAVAVAPAAAIVPPRNCGTMTVESTRYQIKADQIRCTTARSYARKYLESGRRPSGYTCRRGASGSRLTFRCERGIRTFFAIRR